MEINAYHNSVIHEKQYDLIEKLNKDREKSNITRNLFGSIMAPAFREVYIFYLNNFLQSVATRPNLNVDCFRLFNHPFLRLECPYTFVSKDYHNLNPCLQCPQVSSEL